jgi:SpoVK/Ycf46/Vps4 family AAA+-type ATPase
VALEQRLAPETVGAQLWETCRGLARSRLDDLAQRVETSATWDDLVLPALQKQILRDIVVNVRQRARVYDQWGFAAKSSRGLGISALFSGASGTGKTLAAEIMANELCLDLYRIDLSQVVSKYIGETEKNLRRVFDAAETAGAVLLFDEADALFGKRSEVKDSHDRYANIEVSYLLQRMEAYRGLAILTTNMKQALDPAFMRRIRFIVQFPFPDVAERAEIWKRIFPGSTPTADLDVARLAQLNVAGGNIRNIALGAAFLAADEQRPVNMAHLLRIARAEYAKLDRPLTDSEIGGWG